MHATAAACCCYRKVDAKRTECQQKLLLDFLKRSVSRFSRSVVLKAGPAFPKLYLKADPPGRPGITLKA
eukprot:981299-Pelagomonas_calceolata.AAC.3